MTEEVTAKLMESAYHQIERDGILATRLCTHKDDVELTNENKLQQLPGVIYDYCLKCMLHDRSQVGIGGKKNIFTVWVICGTSRTQFKSGGSFRLSWTPLICLTPISCSGILLICKLKLQQEAVESVWLLWPQAEGFFDWFCAMKGAKPSLGRKTSNSEFWY